MHKKTPAGSVDLLVKTKVGEATLPDAVVIEDSSGGGGGGGGGSDPTGLFVRFDIRGDHRALFDTDTNIVGSYRGALGFSIAARDLEPGQSIDIASNFDLDTFTGRTSFDIDPTADEEFSVLVFAAAGGIRMYGVADPSNGTSATVTVASFDPETLTIELEFDADLRVEETGERMTIRGGRSRIKLNDHR